MKDKPGGWFKPQLSFDGVLLLAYTVGTVWFVANMDFKLNANGTTIRAVAKTQIGVLKTLQQMKESLQALNPSNKLDIVIPDAPTFDSVDPSPDTAMIYPLANTKTKDNNKTP